ncbi:Rne/Rng family ribonuclease [Candidatus Pelagibacter ubique]|jgi:ribonuclease E|uniref:Rne/Rng family ribonuclease n=1 Tax=Pelagibacter ubique TaxID=198252 RepID=UPI00035E9696|nr:Rne/Rng family ribonuclease [Candidatus Pelagibacter ubique]MDA7453603.1 Rne/Rng family ribonuclease [Candidatus Pelagibacter ubique]MDA8932648.1 Rne/Rng family ribonuclease [Candidatus Pelagibacter ubique]MDA9158396.1 Rne/Rng family ribonuclease [Candidatus Pelagibacter ubique]MDA9796129.1 Rne/Rng family ribonuclease [Candidatus Pelagibacter ubique]MDC1098681.1 Rne/Rng family ribonuclease [Candidatus Pelagibacter ubique]
MEKNLYIDASHPNETRVVLKSGENIEDYEYEGLKNNLIKNNIYLGKVSRVEPSLQAAFIDFGRDRHGFLSFNDIQSDYYQIPQSDLAKIKEEEEKAREELLKKSELEEQKNINEGNLDINDPVEVKLESEFETNDQITEGSDTPITDTTQVDEDKEQPSPVLHGRKPETRFRSKRYKIQEVIKPNQVILIQVLKDERGQKGAALSTFISIAGKYIVLMPNTPKGGGISRKIFNPGERKKIRTILNDIVIPKEMGLIVRTAGSNKTKNDIDHDLQTLIKTWNEIKENALNSIAPSLIHQESDIIKRTLRDMYDESTNSIVIEGNEGYKKAQNFMKLMMPSHVKKIKKYREKVPLFFKENIEEKLNQIYDSEIKLKSGGYLVINPTEALVSIDINSGSSIKQKNVESTALDTNLEAAEEISRQIKIRDLSGLIIIDFIDMLSFGNRRLVERKLKEQCRTDRARIQIGRISTFGLLEMSRQRLRESAVKWKVTLTDESFAMKILKLVEVKAVLTKAKFVELKICEKISDFMKENFIEDLKYFEEKNLIKIDIIADNSLIIPEYIIDLQNKTKKTIEIVQHIEKLKNLEEQKKEVKSFESSIKKKPYKKPFFKKKFFKKPVA